MERHVEDVYPKTKAGVLCKQMGEEMVLYDTQTESIHTLNQTAHYIWELCDGQHSQEDIVKQVKMNFSNTEEHNIRIQVQEVLDHFRSENLLE